MSETPPETIWVLEDPRAGTAAQALGIAERLGVPFRRIALRWSRAAMLPWPFATLAGLEAPALVPPWPRLVISAGRRSAPVSRWLRAQGVRTVHAMRPGFGAADYDLLVLGAHDQAPPASNIFEILGAPHRVTPAALAAAPPLRGCEVALLLGGPVRGEGMDPALAAGLARQAAELGMGLRITTSRRTGEAAAAAAAATGHPVHRFGQQGANPYLSLLAGPQHLVVTGDSVSMLSEALMSPALLWIADPGGLGARHRRLADSLVQAGRAAWLGSAPPSHLGALDETGRVAAEIRARGYIL